MAILACVMPDIFGPSGTVQFRECYPGLPNCLLATVSPRVRYANSNGLSERFSASNVEGFPTSGDTFIWSGYWYPTNTSETQIMMNFHEGSSIHIQLKRTSSATLEVFRGNGTTSLGASTETYAANTWHYLQIKVVIDDSAGIVVIKVDGDEWINLTSQDTQNGGTGFIDELALQSASGNRDYWGEWFIMDDSGSVNNDIHTVPFIMSIISPDGAGNSTDYTPSTGSNYETVNEVPLAESDYNETSTDAQKDTFTMSSSPADADVIAGVVAFAVGENTTATSTSCKTTVRSNTTEVQGANKLFANGSMNIAMDVVEQDPDAVAAWTKTTVDAMQAGYESVV